jgi:prevent-host-death family protein
VQITISATEARIHFGQLMRDAVGRRQPIVVEKAGKPQVVVLAYDVYQQLVGSGDEEWQTLLVAGYALVNGDLQGRELPSADKILDAAREVRDEELSFLR